MKHKRVLPAEWKHKEDPSFPVVMETQIERLSIDYSVSVTLDGVPMYETGDNLVTVWSRSVPFGSDDAHCAGGYAFREAAREQERISAEWRDAIVAAGV